MMMNQESATRRFRCVIVTIIAMVLVGWPPTLATATRATISVTSQTNRVQVVSPNGGERIPAGTTLTMTWTVSEGTTVFGHNIFFSMDGGETYELLTWQPLSATTRSYDWPIPPNLETTRARIRVFAFNPNLFLMDDSDNNFTIFVPKTPPLRENISLRGGGSRNRLTIRMAGQRVSGSVTGFVDLAYAPTNDPATLSAQITALSFVADSVSIGPAQTGQLLFSKEYTTTARGIYDLATGDFRIPVSLALIYEGLLSDSRTVSTDDHDVRNSPQPVIFSGVLTGRRNPLFGNSNGSLEGMIQGDVPLLRDAAVTIDYLGRLTGGITRLPTVFCPTFCLDAKVVADDAAGSGAVLTSAMVESSLAAVNAIWGQTGIVFTLRDADPATPGTQVTFIPSNTMVADGSGRVLTDGNLRQITDQGVGLTDEQVALTSFSRSGSCLDVYFVDQLVNVDGSPSPETGLTLNAGMGNAAIIVERLGLSESALGMALAHQLGHALGLPHDAVPGSNLMFVDGMGGMALNASQAFTAGMVNPLAGRDSCQDRTFAPLGTDVVITGLNGPNAVVRGIDVTTTIVGRGLAGAQAVEFLFNSGVTAQVQSSSDTTVVIRLSASRDATQGPARFFIRTPNGTASSGVITFDVR